MAEKNKPTNQPLFEQDNKTALTSEMLSTSLLSEDISQKDKDAILRHVHPIFLTTHTDNSAAHRQTYFDKFIAFIRLSLEGILKFFDILVDAAIQVARLIVWIAAISGIIVVVTLMTNTTSGLIDLLNNSVFQYFGIEKKDGAYG